MHLDDKGLPEPSEITPEFIKDAQELIQAFEMFIGKYQLRDISINIKNSLTGATINFYGNSIINMQGCYKGFNAIQIDRDGQKKYRTVG